MNNDETASGIWTNSKERGFIAFEVIFNTEKIVLHKRGRVLKRYARGMKTDGKEDQHTLLVYFPVVVVAVAIVQQFIFSLKK